MTTLFCPSFSSLIFTLHNYPISDFDVLTHNPAIKDFCDKAGIAARLREVQNDLSIKGYLHHKNYCKKICTEFQNREILFCFYAFDFWSLYQLLLLKKHNRVNFYNMDLLGSPGFNEYDAIKIPVANNALVHWKNKSYRNRFFLRIMLLLITGTYFKIFKFSSAKYALGIPPDKCRKIFIPFKNNLDVSLYKNNQNSILKKFNFSKIDVLFIDSGVSAIKYPQSLLTFLKEYSSVGANIFFKQHPTFPPKFNYEGFQLLEKNFPAELLSGIPRAVVGMTSAVIIYFSQSTPVISLFDLVEIEGDYYKTKSELQLNGLNLERPKTIEDLKRLLDKHLGLLKN